jgi:SAM-dependent methyltransferase
MESLATNVQLQREQAEIERSKKEAEHLALKPCEIERYMNPPATTNYPLEYAHHLLGDVRGKTVIDFGCGSGENLVVLLHKGAKVIGLDISPDLVALSEKRVAQQAPGKTAKLLVESAYKTSLADNSVDAVFSIALLHHLDLAMACKEIRRILVDGGLFVMKEPVRFLKTMRFARNRLPARDDISAYEHPLTREEMATITGSFAVFADRAFRLPFVPVLGNHRRVWLLDAWLLKNCPWLSPAATVRVLGMRKA